MTAHLFFLPSVDADTLVVEGDDAHHAARVLRIRPGERVTIADGRGSVASGIVEDAQASRLTVAVETHRAVAPVRPAVTVYQALPKLGKLDEIVPALTQAGVARIVPVRAKRSVARWDERKAAAQTRRLRAIAREAAMQSRRAFIPEVDEPVSIDAVEPGALVLHEEAAARLFECLPASPPDRVSLLVGPEGGLDPAEVSALEARGCPAVTLGDGVFRTETAALAGAVLVLGRYGVLG